MAAMFVGWLSFLLYKLETRHSIIECADQCVGLNCPLVSEKEVCFENVNIIYVIIPHCV